MNHLPLHLHAGKKDVLLLWILQRVGARGSTRMTLRTMLQGGLNLDWKDYTQL